ncbi:SDR family NAD(P)-dependent oxidoreductase [Sphaerimonospora sp. CA-214678]|uniref:SDR family NAD(P)-dependent oxidoreductase n=1 Tax=Sphaerimonospora sp. CA-214678 TaxID=3240029 RepID=UPI003D89DAC0
MPRSPATTARGPTAKGRPSSERDGRSADKAALITGAASGIGWSTTEMFVREGVHVHAVDRDREAMGPC